MKGKPPPRSQTSFPAQRKRQLHKPTSVREEGDGGGSRHEGVRNHLASDRGCLRLLIISRFQRFSLPEIIQFLQVAHGSAGYSILLVRCVPYGVRSHVSPMQLLRDATLARKGMSDIGQLAERGLGLLGPKGVATASGSTYCTGSLLSYWATSPAVD